MIALGFQASFGDFELDFAFESEAASVGIFGPSGSGKTSVLELTAGWRRARSGHARVGDRTLFDSERGIDLPIEARGVGYVPQDLLLFPHWSVARNVTAGGAQRFERVMDVLELSGLVERRVDSLSGGERQRVALARALCSGADLLALDEPMGALDLPLRRRILPWLVRVREEFGVPMLLVSHDPTEIQALCEHVVILRGGKVFRRGPPGEVLAEALRPERASFENVLRGVVRATRPGSADVELAPGILLRVSDADLAPDQGALVGIRAEDILLARERPNGLSARNILPGKVLSARHTDGECDLTVALAERLRLHVHVTPEAVRELGLEAGVGVHLVIKTHSCRVLAALPG
jgi:molybdate transport system ATP-binding protein